MTAPNTTQRSSILKRTVLAGSIIACTGWFLPGAHAQFYATTFRNTGGGTFVAGDTANRTLQFVGGGLFDQANWTDPEGGNNGAFGNDIPIPGNTSANEDNYSLYASGILHVVETGDYNFKDYTDDASRIVIDGRNVLVQTGCCGVVTGPTIHLEAGSTHFISVTYAEGGGGSGGEFFVNRVGVGTDQLLGKQGAASVSPDMFVDQTGFTLAANVGVNQGLPAKYYQLGGNNQNRDIDTFLATNPAPLATFTSTTLNYNSPAATDIGTHLGADSNTFSDPLILGNSTDNTLFTFDGFLQITPGDDLDLATPGIQVKFALDGDDNLRLRLGGLTIIENDGPHGTNHFVSANTDLLSAGTGDNAGGTAIVSLPSGGLYALSAFYHNGAVGIAGLLTSSIGLTNGNVQAIPSSRLFQSVLPFGVPKFWTAGATTATWGGPALNWNTDNTTVPGTFAFIPDDTANFGNLGTQGPRIVNIDAGGVVPRETIVNNSAANPYTIGGGGGGSIGGLGGLTKTGNGSLTLGGNNTFAGKTTILHGTVNVATIGDANNDGNLGRGIEIALGDTTGANDAKLNYTGVTATANRALTMGANGGEVGIASGQALTLSGNFSGTGPLLKSGNGDLVLSGTGGTGFTGGITSTGGGLTVARLGVGTGAIALSGNTNFTYSGASFDDTRNLTVSSGTSIVSVSNGNSRLKIATANSTGGTLNVGGAGRLTISGAATLPTLPTIAAGSTLALANEGAGNVLPATLTVPSGTLELAPNPSTVGLPINLTGGTVRLGHEGLQGFYYNGAYNQGAWQNSVGSVYRGVVAGFTALGLPIVAARTTTNGQTNLDFGNNNGSTAVPFANQGNTAGDDVRVAFAGKILITSAGNTQFFTTSDDGSTIFIDGQRVVNNNAYQGMTERSGTINLSAGLHDILVTFHEGGGGAGLIAQYTPAGGSKQVISNSVLYSGDIYDSVATNVTVTANSGLEIGSSVANLGTLSQNAATTLTLNGSANFTGTTLSGTGDHGIATNSPLSSVNLGTITNGAGNTITKTGNGALVLSSPTAPTGLTINVNAGQVVIQASHSGVAQNDPLGNTTVNLNGGGLGFSIAPGSAAGTPLAFTNNAVSTQDYRISAGAYNDNVFTAVNAGTINWNPANNQVNIAADRTATFEVNATGFIDNNNNAVPGYILNVGAPVIGGGSLVLEQGRVNFGAAAGVTAPGGLTVRAAISDITGPITTGALNMSGSFAGVNAGDLNTPNIGTLHAFSTVSASSVNMNGNNLTVDGVLTNTGAFTQARGTVNLAASSHASVAVNGGTLNANGSLTSPGAVTVTAGVANLNGGSHNVASVTVNGSGDLALRGNLTTAGVTSVSNGRTFTVDAGAGNTANYNGSSVTLANNSRVNVNSGIADMSGTTISATPVVITIEQNRLNGRLFVLGPDFSGTPRLDPQDQNIVNQLFLGGNPNNTALLTGALSFPDDGSFTALFGGTNPGNQNFTAAFVGRYTPSVTGNTSFQTRINDDQASLWVDLNQNGTFEIAGSLGSERIGNAAGCCGPGVLGNANLTAGQIYNVFFGVQDTGGGGNLEAQFNGIVINPGDAAQAGLWSSIASNNQGGNLRVGTNSELRVKSFTGITNLTLDLGTAAGAQATVRLPNSASATVSDTQTLAVTGTTPMASVILGDNNQVNVGRITVANNGTLVLDKAVGATTGGVLALNGSVQGFVGTTPSTIGAGSINVQGGTLLANAPITGTGSVIASVAGVIGGNAAIEPAVTANSGGTISPGSFTLGAELANLGTGNLTLNGGSALRLDISNLLSYDSLTVLGGVTLNGNPTLLINRLNFTGALNDVYYIVNNDLADPVTGVFNNVPDGGIIDGPDGLRVRISYDANFGVNFADGGNDIALQVVQVPEPGSLVALVSGIGMLLGMQRIRRRSA